MKLRNNQIEMSSDQDTRRRGNVKVTRKLLACVALGAALVVAGCGGDDESSQGGAAKNSQGVQQAKAFVEKWSKPQTSIGIDKPLSKTPPKGKTIAHIRCPIEGCEAIFTGLQEASQALGWNVEAFNMDNTPEGVNQAFESALERKPDGIVISGIPAQVYQQHLDEAKAAGIPVVSLSVIDQATGMDGNGIIATINQAKQTERFGELVGNWIVADDNGAGKDVAIFTVANFPTLKPFAETVQRIVKQLCSECGTQIVNVQVTDVGRRMPNQVVSTIQQNPDIKYVAMAFGQMSTGVRPALNAAGYKDIKLVGEGAYAANLEALRKGDEQMWAGLTSTLQGWYSMDAFARFFDGDSVKPTDEVIMPTQVLTKGNVGTDKWYLGPKDSQQQFKDLWKVAG
jgi:ribose transport system substrate-binding protein